MKITAMLDLPSVVVTSGTKSKRKIMINVGR